MSPLSRKLLRDLLALRTQALAICAVMACGVATFVMSLSTLDSLQRMQADYYREYRFAEVFASLKRAPDSVERRLAEIPGVARVTTRVVREVTLDLPGMDEPAVGRLISIDRGLRAGRSLNALHLRRGRWPDAFRRGEVLVSEAFASAHDLEPGDGIPAVLNGRREVLRIVGVALSPEYVFQMQGGELIPDERRFAVLWMAEEQLAPAFDLEGAFNDVAVTLTRDAREPAVITALDAVLDRYGGRGAYERRDQPSHHRAQDEMEQLKGWSVLPPVIFLLVSAFLLNMVVARLVGAQRAQIGVLRAFGIRRWEIAAHYLGMVFTLVAVSGLVGIGLGRWFGAGLTAMYAEYYHFPNVHHSLGAGTLVAALGVCSLAAVAGTLGAVARAARVPPAEAMRPEPPAAYRPSLLERSGLDQVFSRSARQTARMVLRNLERRPLKAAMSVLGIALAVAVLIVGTYVEDSAGALLHFQFELSQRQDVMVSLVEPSSMRALAGLQRLPGVRRGEPFRVVPARLHFGHRSRRQEILGLPTPPAQPAVPRLFRQLDADLRPVTPPPEGILLSRTLADLLGVSIGDRLHVEVLEGERPVLEVTVTDLFTSYVGTSATMDLRALHRLLGEEGTLSGAFLSLEPADRSANGGPAAGAFYREVKKTPRIAGVADLRVTRRLFRQALEENLMTTKAINLGFAVIIAFGVVYNSARVSLVERARELGTLRVLGYSRAEISGVLLGELAILTAVALPLGLGLGYLFASAVTDAMATETHRFPLVIGRFTYFFAAAVVAAAALVSGLVVRRRLDRLDLTAVLKSQE